MKKQSLGLIETWGLIPAIEAADAGVKSADVTLLGYEIIKVALVTVKFSGNVAAVKAAVDAGAVAAKKVGKVVAVHVIPRPDRQIRIDPSDEPPSRKTKAVKPKPPTPLATVEKIAVKAKPPKLPKVEEAGDGPIVKTPPQKRKVKAKRQPEPPSKKKAARPKKLKPQGKAKKPKTI